MTTTLLLILVSGLTSGGIVGGLAIGHADFLDKQLASSKFEIIDRFENILGYDYNFTDNFYTEFRTEFGRNIDLVNANYARKEFQDVRITSSSSSAVDKSISNSAYNFAVAQKSFTDWATLTDRWDIRVTSFNHQFIGLYHGSDPFVTNRMRSYMIRWLGNGIKDYLPVLDATLSNLSDHKEIIQTELKSVIRYIIMRLHTKIKNLWSDLDYFDAHETPDTREATAGGSLVIVSKAYIIVVNMGGGRVFTCDDKGKLSDFTSAHENPSHSLFINGGYPEGRPFIHIQPKRFNRDDEQGQVKFVLLESATVAQVLNQDELSEIVQREFTRDANKSEVELYSAIANQTMQRVTDKMNTFEDKSLKLDHSIVIVGLEQHKN